VLARRLARICDHDRAEPTGKPPFGPSTKPLTVRKSSSTAEQSDLGVARDPRDDQIKISHLAPAARAEAISDPSNCRGYSAVSWGEVQDHDVWLYPRCGAYCTPGVYHSMLRMYEN
jgi:hypothetical protein